MSWLICKYKHNQIYILVYVHVHMYVSSVVANNPDKINEKKIRFTFLEGELQDNNGV